MSDYAKFLIIQDSNSPSFINISPNENHLYNIDLNSRTIDKINTIIVESDHKSRVLYFKAPRYFDGIDLANMICIIEYINVKKENYTYIVPFYDIETFAEENAIGFYWEISQTAAKASGNITYAMTFYKIDSEKKKFLYRLNTLPQTFNIKNGIGFTVEDKRIEEQYVESKDENFLEGKTYYSKTVENILDKNGNIKKDETGTEIIRIIFSEEKIKQPNKVYYEKIDLYNNSIDNYFEVLTSAIQQAQTGDLKWIVLK